MPQVSTTVDCPIYDSFRVQQVAGMFDVPLAARATAAFAAELPALEEPWTIGLVVGPSGSGKSTLARQHFGQRLIERHEWPADRAVIDCLGNLSIRQITGLLTAVGFSSPPAWIKPYQVLSRGEQFRCDLARALAGCLAITPATKSPTAIDPATDPTALPLVVFDEFTSVVDRTVAQIGSAAVSKAIRSRRIPARFVAVSCHYDIAEWLEPDWVADLATGQLLRRRLRRPTIRLEVARCSYRAWPLFARHHYLSGSLGRAVRCHAAFWQDQPVAFCATLPLFGKRGQRRISRLVTLPDFQGIGIGLRLAEAVAELHRAEGYRISVTASHPALIAHCQRSPLWQARRVMKTGSRNYQRCDRNYRGSHGRAVVSFEYLGQPAVAALQQIPEPSTCGGSAHAGPR